MLVVKKVEEKDLIRGCIRENRNCQKEVFQRYSGKMMAVCLRYSRNRMEAEDILQDAFIKVFDNIAKFKFKGSFESWIRRIVINTALKNFQKKQSLREQSGLEVEMDFPIQPSIFAHLQEEDLLNLVAKLPPGYRLVFNLYAIEGYSHREIADLLNIEEGTSRSQLLKARKMLQLQIAQLQKVAV